MTLAEVYTLMQSESPDLGSISYYDHIEVDEGEEVFPPFIILWNWLTFLAFLA